MKKGAAAGSDNEGFYGILHDIRRKMQCGEISGKTLLEIKSFTARVLFE